MKTIKTVLLLGSGALKIGEAGEFDYSGTQAIKALKEEGVRVILVNPNVATVQTSAGLADTVYFLSVTPHFVEEIIKKEKPDGILLSFGGQTALNCGLALASAGILDKYQVEILGTPIAAIEKTEDRQLFAEHLAGIGLKAAKGKIVGNVASGLEFAESIGFPVMIRAGYALGGTGSGIAATKIELELLLTNAFATTTQVIIEESLWGWKELEYEVVRDADDNCIIVCNMENFDPVGIHTGESIVVSPSQTLNDTEYFHLRQAAIDTIKSLHIIGECNIQFALNPQNEEIRVIEVNARLSRSSALASKATGYPLAYIAAKLSLGKHLPELTNTITKNTTAFFEPALDYITVKIPRWDLDKFSNVKQTIGSEMKSVGEVMAIGRSFEEAIQKAIRMLNLGFEGVIDTKMIANHRQSSLQVVGSPDPNRIFKIISALISGTGVDDLASETGIDPWFLAKLKNITDLYQRLQSTSEAGFDRIPTDLLLEAKQTGFSDRGIADIFCVRPDQVRQKRISEKIIPWVKRIDTMSGEFPALTNYLYMTYNASTSDHLAKCDEEKIMVLGCGPYAIGTSVEFDWCAVQAISAIRDNNRKAIMVNCNPETVSTDYDMSDYLYFEELSLERILDIWDIEKAPVVVSVGGQIANNLALNLSIRNIPILGTSPKSINKAESRDEFSKLLDDLKIPQPKWSRVRSLKELQDFVSLYGYPVLVRPSFVLSGKAMSVLESDEIVNAYMDNLAVDIGEFPLVVSQFLAGAKECDFDGVAGNGVIVESALSEHIEYGGVHSGDASMVLPSSGISPKMLGKIGEFTRKIVGSLSIDGPFNIQYLIRDEAVFVIECNARASRSFPFVSKVYHRNFIKTAVAGYLGNKITPRKTSQLTFKAVKVPQFSFNKLRGADPVTTVEMNSTGEVVGFGRDIHEAYLTAIISTGVGYPTKKAVFLSLGGASGKLSFLPAAKILSQSGFKIYATAGTSLFLRENNISISTIGKIYEGGHPNITDLLKGKLIDFAVVIPEHAQDSKRGKLLKGATDGYIMRRLAIDLGVPVFTNSQNARVFVEAVTKYKLTDLQVKSWQEYTAEIEK
jgi:carbamoyl-phosphate synthase large subunit